jgi:hypothetical protein
MTALATAASLPALVGQRAPLCVGGPVNFVVLHVILSLCVTLDAVWRRHE